MPEVIVDLHEMMSRRNRQSPFQISESEMKRVTTPMQPTAFNEAGMGRTPADDDTKQVSTPMQFRTQPGSGVAFKTAISLD